MARAFGQCRCIAVVTTAIALFSFSACGAAGRAPVDGEWQGQPVDTGAWDIRGAALGMHSGDDAADYRPALKEIRGLGANAVELVIPYFQSGIRSSEPGSRKDRTPSLKVIARTIDDARQAGLRVYLLPIVLLESAGEREWRGAMKPDDLELWWRNYGELVLDLGMVAESRGAEGLSVGSELLWSETMRDRWERLIREVRSVYGGRIIYSANWDHYTPVSFWDLTDAMAISGYFELTRDPAASQEELDSAWTTFRSQISSFADKKTKTVIFTEFGYPALDGGAVYPWDYTMKSSPDPMEQAMAVSAFLKAWKDQPRFGGAFYYEWDLPGGTRSKYSPRGLPAERILRDWYRELPPSSNLQSKLPIAVRPVRTSAAVEGDTKS